MAMWSLVIIGSEILFFSLVGKLVLVAKWKLEVVRDMIDAQRTRPADMLVLNWVLGKPTAFEITVTSLLTPITLHEASVTSGSTAQEAENRNMPAMMQNAQSWGVCVPLAVKVYGCWRPEAQMNLSRLLQGPGHFCSLWKVKAGPSQSKCSVVP